MATASRYSTAIVLALVIGACSSPQKEERKVEEKPREGRPAVTASASCGSPNTYSFSATLKDDNGSPVAYKKVYVYGVMVNERTDVRICENSSDACSFTVTSERPCTSAGARAVFYLPDGSRKIAQG